jgi:hypothetical protein
VKRDITTRILFLAPLLFAPSFVRAQSLIIPQIADGGAWQTTLVLTNTSASPASASLSFFEEISVGTTQAWNLQFLEVSNTQNLSIPAGATIILHTQDNPSASTNTGWAQMQSSTAVSAYAIFTQHVPGRQDQDGTAPAAPAASRILVPFDNSNGFVTTIAIANTTAVSENISVNLLPNSGVISSPSPITLPGQGHAAFALPTQFAATNGISGTLEFYIANGSFSILALRFNPTGAFTAAPVYSETGPPVIGSNPGGTLPQFNMIVIHASPSSVSPSPNVPPYPELGITQILVFVPVADGIYAGGTVQGVILSPSGNGATAGQYAAGWGKVTVSGQTLTFTGLEVSGSTMADNSGNLAQITSGSLTVTLSPQAVTSSGSVTGSLNLVSTVATVSGPFTGTYVAQ